MVAQFLAGVIVGALIGLALAPLLRSWMSWQMTKPWREAAFYRHGDSRMNSFDEEPHRAR
jgi:hypothetical protein